MGQLGELINIGIHAADKAIELRQHLGYVGRNLGERAREDVEIVVAIEFQFTEFRQRVIERM